MKRKYRALILAAGLGTRLKPYTDYLPKCLMEIGGKPLISHWLDRLSDLECESVLVNTHYKAEQVQNYISSLNYKKMFIKTTYEKKLLGTARTLINNIDFFNNFEIILMHADNFSFVNLKDLLQAHENRNKDALLTMLTFNSKNPSSCGIVCKNDKGLMTSFHEKVADPPSNCANGAIYILTQEFINWLVKYKSNAIDFSIDILPFLSGLVQTWHTNLPYIDIGTPETLIEARNFFKNRSYYENF